DVDGNGFPDIVVGNYYGLTVGLYLGNGTTFNDVVDIPVNLDLNLAVDLVDLTGEGKPDLVVAARYKDRISVLPGDGAGGFGPEFVWLVPRYPVQVIDGDLEGDGKADIVAVGGNVVTLRNTNCESRRLAASTDVSTCNLPGQPFAQQPSIGVYDDGGNL